MTRETTLYHPESETRNRRETFHIRSLTHRRSGVSEPCTGRCEKSLSKPQYGVYVCFLTRSASIGSETSIIGIISIDGAGHVATVKRLELKERAEGGRSCLCCSVETQGVFAS